MDSFFEFQGRIVSRVLILACMVYTAMHLLMYYSVSTGYWRCEMIDRKLDQCVMYTHSSLWKQIDERMGKP